jgi:pyrroloquinoline-quinone synthase
MSNFAAELESEVSQYNLLQHPFYEAWNEGKLNSEIIKDYAKQYYHHVKAFPRYLSATHSICENLEDRKILLENLNDEENNGVDHPTLWKRFATGMGNSEEEVDNAPLEAPIQKVIETFFKYSRASYAEGLAALYTYEHQIPEIAKTKIEGLKKFYASGNKQVLEFFQVHERADVWHREQCQILLNRMSKEDQTKAKHAAVEVAKALWGFLTGVAEKHSVAC